MDQAGDNKENFFTKLRRLGKTVQHETALQEENMKKPIGLRSSNSNHRPPHLIFKEMLHDAQNVKRDANQTLNVMKSEGQNFQDIVAAVQSLCELQNIQIQETEEYLQQYGYEAYKKQQIKGEKKTLSEKCQKSNENDKENIPEEKHQDQEQQLDAQMEESQPTFATPLKSITQQGTSEETGGAGGGNKTPQLSDFGLSQAALDRIAMMNMPKSSQQKVPSGSMLFTPAKTYNLTHGTSIPSYYPPMTTPICEQVPFADGTVLVTPGLFGNRHIPNETPEQFMDKALPKPDMESTPVPPVLSTVKKWPQTSSHMAPPPPPAFDTTDEVSPSTPDLPQPPDMTVAWGEIIPAAPQFQQNLLNPNNHGDGAHVFQSTSVGNADVTPPMPVFQTTSAASTMPTAPVRLASKYASNTMPQEPVQLASHVHHVAEMPCRPVLLADKLGISATMPQEPIQLASHVHYVAEMPSRPVLLADKLGIPSTMPTEPMQLISQISNDISTPPPPVLLTQRLGANHYIPSNLSQPQLTSQAPRIPAPSSTSQAPRHPAPSSTAVTYTPQQPPSMVNTNCTNHAIDQYQSHTSQVTMATGVTTSQGGVGLPVGVTPQKPFSFTRMQHLEEDEMPKTPELTMTYKRFVDINPPVAPAHPVSQSHDGYQPSAPGGGRHGQVVASEPSQIAPIMAEEFSQVQDYLQRILPLNVINGHIDTLNQILLCKPDSTFITEEETKIVDLGPQLKVMLLLLCKLKRWKSGKSPETNEPVYFLL